MGILVGTGVSLRYIAEVTRGTTPVTGPPAWKFLRATGRNINLKKDILESAEVSTTRQRSDVRHGFNRIEGDIGYELSQSCYDEILAYAMARPHVARDPADNAQVALTGASSYDGWLQPGDVHTNVTISAVTAATSTAPGTITFTLAGTSTTTHWIDLGYRPGDWVQSSGWTDTDNNTGTANAPAHWKVLSIGGTNGGGDLVCQIPAGFTGQATDATPGASKKVVAVGRKISIGTTLTTISLERAFVDGTSSDTYQLFKGCAVNTMAMTIRPEAIVGGTFGFVGMSGAIDNTSTQTTVGSGTLTSIGSNAPFGVFDGAATITNSSGAHITAIVTGLDFNLDNQRTLFPVVGSKFSQDVYEGVAKVTGTLTLLLDGTTHLSVFANESVYATVVIRLNELGVTNSFMSLVFCRVKLTAADIDPPQNGPVVINCTFEALEQTFNGFASSQTDVRSKEVFRIQRTTTNIV